MTEEQRVKQRAAARRWYERNREACGRCNQAKRTLTAEEFLAARAAA